MALKESGALSTSDSAYQRGVKFLLGTQLADGVYYPKNSWQALRLLLRLDFDIAHLHFGGNLNHRILGVGLLCCLLPGVGSVLTFHSGGYPASERGRTAHRWTWRAWVLRRFDRVIAVNEEILSFMRRLGVAPQRARLISPHDFPALDDPQAETTMPRPMEEFFGSHHPVLIAVTCLEPEYNLALQVEALGAVRERHRQAGLLLVGSGSLERQLRLQIAAKPYAEHVLLAGDVVRPATLQAIARSDLMLRTTLYDGDAVSVREALHLGTPVIATDNRMRPAGVHLIPAGDLAALVGKIEQVLDGPPATRPASLAADESNLEAVVAVYRELVRR